MRRYMTPKVAAVRRKDETTTRSNKNGDYRIHTKTWLSTNSTRDSQDDRKVSIKCTRTFGKDVRAWYFGDGRKTGRIKSDKGSGV